MVPVFLGLVGKSVAWGQCCAFWVLLHGVLDLPLDHVGSSPWLWKETSLEKLIL